MPGELGLSRTEGKGRHYPPPQRPGTSCAGTALMVGVFYGALPICWALSQPGDFNIAEMQIPIRYAIIAFVALMVLVGIVIGTVADSHSDQKSSNLPKSAPGEGFEGASTQLQLPPLARNRLHALQNEQDSARPMSREHIHGSRSLKHNPDEYEIRQWEIEVAWRGRERIKALMKGKLNEKELPWLHDPLSHMHHPPGYDPTRPGSIFDDQDKS